MLEAMRCPPGQHQGLEPHAKHGPAPTTLNLGGRAQGPPQTPLSGIPNTFVGSFPTKRRGFSAALKEMGVVVLCHTGLSPPPRGAGGPPGLGLQQDGDGGGPGCGAPHRAGGTRDWLLGVGTPGVLVMGRTGQGWSWGGGSQHRGHLYWEDQFAQRSLILGGLVWGLALQRPLLLGGLGDGVTSEVLVPHDWRQLPCYWEHWGGGRHPRDSCYWDDWGGRLPQVTVSGSA